MRKYYSARQIVPRMEILGQYSRALWNAYHKTLKKKQRKKLKKDDEIKLAKVLFETKKLCMLIDKQRDAWGRGHQKTWPVDPYTERQPDSPLVFTLEGYPHMAPEIKKFMDRSAVEYVKIFGEK